MPEPEQPGYEFLNMLKGYKRDFDENVAPETSSRRDPSGWRRGKRKKGGNRKSILPSLRLHPFTLKIFNGFFSQTPTARKTADNPTRFNRANHTGVVRPSITEKSTNFNRIVSVFIIAKVSGEKSGFILQKAIAKSGLGFPGGSIEEGESIIEAACREFFEESGGTTGGGIKILPYNPKVIGKFELAKAQAGEQGVLVLVEIPESELKNIKRDPVEIEKVYLSTHDQIEALVKGDKLLTNTVVAWSLYKNIKSS